MNNEQLVSICVVCAHANHSRGTGFPLVCPKLNMPCMALDSCHVLNNRQELISVSEKNNGRLPLLYADEAFLDLMAQTCHQLVRLGVDVTKGTVY